MSQMAAIKSQIIEADNRIAQYTREKYNWNANLTLLQQNASSISVFNLGGGQDATISQNQMLNYINQQETIFKQQIAKCDTMIERWNELKTDYEGQSRNAR